MGMKKQILVVDDEKEIRELLQKRLSAEGYEVFAAADGFEALEICRLRHPDLVLLDVALPRLDGYQTCEKIKQDARTKDIAVLFLTGKELEPQSIIDRCNELGAYGFLHKPCAAEDLLKRIEEILSGES